MDQIADQLAQDPPPGAPPTRTLTAHALGKLVKKSKSVILHKWIDAGCPCEKREVRGQPAYFFNVQEVQAWMEQTGRTAGSDEPETTDPAAMSTGPVATAETDLFAARRAELTGDVDYDLLVGKARATLERHLATTPPQDAEAGWAAKWTKEFSGALDQLLKMDDRRFLARQRSGNWMERARARRILEDEGAQFAQDLERINSDLAHELMLELASLVPADQHEQARRLIAAASRRVTDGVRARRAESIRRALEALDRAAEEVRAAA